MLPSLALAAALFIQPAPEPHQAVDQARLMASIAALPRERSGNGGPEGWAGLKATEELVLQQLRGLGYEPDTQDIGWRPHFRRPAAPESAPEAAPEAASEPAPAPEPPVFRNIIIDLPGTDLRHEVLLISAHIDAVPGTPGADDDGTGVAAVLEIARVLKDRPMRRTVRLVLFNLEEVGLVGSRRYAMDLAQERLPIAPDDRLVEGTPEETVTAPDGTPERPSETIIGMASLEMLGYFSDQPGSQSSPIPPIKDVFEPPTVGDFIAIISTRGHAGFVQRLREAMTAAAPGLKTGVVDFAPDMPLTPPSLLRSDHAPFLALGIPGVMVTDTANFRNPTTTSRPTNPARLMPSGSRWWSRASRGRSGRSPSPRWMRRKSPPGRKTERARPGPAPISAESFGQVSSRSSTSPSRAASKRSGVSIAPVAISPRARATRSKRISGSSNIFAR